MRPRKRVVTEGWMWTVRCKAIAVGVSVSGSGLRYTLIHGRNLFSIQELHLNISVSLRSKLP
jgi:hypothetical protein